MVSQVIGQVGVVRRQKQKVKVKPRQKQRMRDHHQVRNQVCPKISKISDKIFFAQVWHCLRPRPRRSMWKEQRESSDPSPFRFSSEYYFCLSKKSKRKTKVWKPILLCEYCESQSSELKFFSLARAWNPSTARASTTTLQMERTS